LGGSVYLDSAAHRARDEETAEQIEEAVKGGGEHRRHLLVGHQIDAHGPEVGKVADGQEHSGQEPQELCEDGRKANHPAGDKQRARSHVDESRRPDGTGHGSTVAAGSSDDDDRLDSQLGQQHY
jgi:hypothetical protein